MRNAFIEIYNAKKQIKRSFRDSAYYISLKKIRNFYTVEGFPKRYSSLILFIIKLIEDSQSMIC